jgi:CRP/FNR family transcriptional regulator, cyclic AMP receptor protein
MVPLETLKHIQFLQDFSDDHLQHLASLAEIKEFPAGGEVFREGQSSSSVYLVVQGNITLEINVPTRGAMQFQTVGSGELLGWTPVLGPGPMTATARVQTPSTLLALNAAQMKAFCAHDLSFGFAFMQRIAQVLSSRLSATRLLLMDVFREEELPSRRDRIA